MNTHRVRRVVGAASAGALALGLSAGLATSTAQAAVDERPATLGAAWLAAQPVDGLVTTSSEWEGEVSAYVDQGLSLDVAFALDAVGEHPETVAEIRDAVAAEVAAGRYIQGDEYDWQEPSDFVQVGYYSGATAKALTAAVELGGDPADFGGVDLVERLEGLVQPTGRLQDDSSYGDYANSIGQGFAVRGLSAAGSEKADEVTDFLLLQQCDNGGFRLDFTRTGGVADESGCTDSAQADPDVTSYALMALQTLEAPSSEVTGAIEEGVEYLVDLQKADGSFGGGTSTEESNANSTGLAGTALAALGETEAAEDAAAWVRSHQLTGIVCEPGAGAEVGAIAYNDADLAAAAADGIDDLERGVFVRAAAQALPVLRFAPAAEGALGVAGPSGFVKAGGKVTLTAEGIAPGERACLVGGKAAVAVTGGSSGATAATVALPAGTSTRTLTLVTADATTSTTVQALGKTKLDVKAKKAQVKRGKKVKVTVKGLAAGEKVIVKLAGKKAAAGKANAKGTFTAKVKVGRKTGKAKLKAVGQFKNRSGATTVKVK